MLRVPGFEAFISLVSSESLLKDTSDDSMPRAESAHLRKMYLIGTVPAFHERLRVQSTDDGCEHCREECMHR